LHGASGTIIGRDLPVCTKVSDSETFIVGAEAAGRRLRVNEHELAGEEYNKDELRISAR
jgi:hypothetical protein